MDKEDVHVHNGILLSHEIEQNWVICRDVNGCKVCLIKLSQKEKNKYCTLTHMSNLEKWSR